MKRLLPRGRLATPGCSSGSDEDDGQSVRRGSAKAPVEETEAVEGLVPDSGDRFDEPFNAAGE